LQVVDNKPKATIAQIVKTKTPTPLPAAPAVPAQLRIITMKRNYPPVVPCYFDLACDGQAVGRVVMDVYYKEAPLMARNFIELCTGQHGVGYRFSDLWNVADNDHIVGGQLREGEVSIYNQKAFLGDASKLHDGVGMLRMRGHRTSDDGRAVVSSQFMIWMKPKEFKSYARTLVIGKVTKGMEFLQAVPTMNGKSKDQPKKSPFKIIECGINA
jgi:cyclophilin family peptidyl-prolyl cis-trans isomerase